MYVYGVVKTLCVQDTRQRYIHRGGVAPPGGFQQGDGGWRGQMLPQAVHAPAHQLLIQGLDQIIRGFHRPRRAREVTILHLIIVEDLEIDREVLANLILDDCSRQEERADLSFYSSGEDFLARYRPKCCDGLFLDVLLDGVNGIDIAGRVREAEPDLPIIITTRERDFAVDGFAVKATDYLVKPLDQKLVGRCKSARYGGAGP